MPRTWRTLAKKDFYLRRERRHEPLHQRTRYRDRRRIGADTFFASVASQEDAPPRTSVSTAVTSALLETTRIVFVG